MQQTLILLQLGTAQAAADGQQVGDAPDLALHGLAPRLGGVGGEDGVELQLLQQLRGLGRAHLLKELAVGAGHLVDGVGALDLQVHLALAFMQDLHPVVLLAEVGQVEVGGQGAGQQLGILD